MNPPKMLLVSAEMLPSVFTRVLEAKRLLAVGKVKNLSEAAKVSGISRSALYKYKDHVFVYNEDIDQSVVTINVYLEDRPGVLSTLINRFSQEGANILTVNQNIPAGGPCFHLRPSGKRQPGGGHHQPDQNSGRRCGRTVGQHPVKLALPRIR